MSYSFDLSKPDKKARKESVKWILGHLARNKIQFFGMIIGIILVNFLYIGIPFLIGVVIDEAIIPKDYAALKFYAILILGLGSARVIMNYITIYLNLNLSAKSVRDVRTEFFESLQKKPLTFHNRVRSGDLMALATQDMNELGGMISPGIRMMAETFLSLIVIIILAFNTNLTIALFLLPVFILYIIGIQHFNKTMRPIARVFNQKWSLISRAAQDSITGVRVVRAFNGEEYEMKEFSKVVNDFRHTWEDRQIKIGKFWSLLILYFTIGSTFLIGVYLISIGQLQIGELVSLNLILLMLIGPTETVSFAVNMFQGGLAGGERIFRTINFAEAEDKLEDSKLPWNENYKGKINFQNVSFGYEGTEKTILRNISFEVLPGEIVALVGPTGSGKTTITKLLLRFYEFHDGKITIDDTDILDINIRELRQNIGRVEQDVFIYATTIKENILFGVDPSRNVSLEEIIQAAKIAQAHEFIEEMENGYDTVVGERGVGLSGGQKQRIAIARALLVNPRILILDDSTSAIDSETEEKISKAMDEVMKNRTTFLITHRLSA
ncbi:MAG: ABC transporter ATP-binding protein/permease, partial [Candidatus Heimdallarchaeota archaeon]|nr:ABC transporter ATP-binding protein/permease [Candidatus Heimdallarchaeota archaeon]